MGTLRISDISVFATGTPSSSPKYTNEMMNLLLRQKNASTWNPVGGLMKAGIHFVTGFVEGVEPGAQITERCVRGITVPIQQVAEGLRHVSMGMVKEGNKELITTLAGFALLANECLRAAKYTTYDNMRHAFQGPVTKEKLQQNLARDTMDMYKNVITAAWDVVLRG